MAGQTFEIIAKSRISFPNLGSGNYGRLVVATGIDVSQFREITMIVRMHDNDLTGMATIAINGTVEAPTTDDPGTDFVYGTGGTDPADYNSVIAVTTTALTPAPSLQYAGPYTGFLGGFMRFWLVGYQPSTMSVAATISVQLYCKA